MIQIKETGPLITVAGHATIGKILPSPVCEDVTVLLQNLIYSTEALTEDPIEYSLKKGFSFLKYKERTLSEQAQLLKESFFVGICAIANSDPDKVQVSRLE